MFGRVATIAAAVGAGLGWTSSPGNQVRQVAIIGGGPAGSSAAYHLHKYAEDAGLTLNVTLFEKENRFGGRSLTVPVYGDGDEVELGASIFVELNTILCNASQEFGLNTIPSISVPGVMGIWDGDELVFSMDDNHTNWWNLAKLFWKYGMAPYRAQKTVESTIGTFLQMYTPDYFPFTSLTEVAMKLGLTKVTGVTGTQFLEEQNIGAAYAHDIIQASTRVNYASNLDYIHGLDSMVSMAPDGAMQVEGGNWQIFENMAKSGAHVYLSTAISSISLKGKASPSPYVLRQENSTGSYPILFDDVVLATPHQFSDIAIQEGILQQPIDSIPYADLHVTLFTSPLKLDPVFFNLPAGKPAPRMILTTLSKGEEPAVFPEGAGKPGFYSISTLRTVINPKTEQVEYIYKIFSPDDVTSEFLSRLFGVKVPELSEQEVSGDGPISWVYPYTFHAYPVAYPRVTFQDPILAPGLYYTSGMDSFISTMETNALSGMNVARLIVDGMVSAAATDEKAGTKSGDVEEEQKVL